LTDTTYEEARRCPRCNNPGAVAGTRRGPHGSTLNSFVCKTPRCRWFETQYVVQINADGTIPEPTLDRDKSFPKLPERTEEAIQAQMNRLYEQTLNGGETR
jgi:hypothetical protein